jgi:thiol-disulfide isomerase/thioredoxin
VVWGGGALLAVGLVIGLVATSSTPLRHAPSFRLPRLGGGPAVGLPLPGTATHLPVVLTFFASWCGPCHRDLPVIAAAARREEAAGGRVQFLGVDGNDGAAAGLAFARRSGVTFPVAADAASAVAPRFTLDGYPDTVFIDATGQIVGTVRGPVSRATLDRWLARLAPASST